VHQSIISHRTVSYTICSTLELTVGANLSGMDTSYGTMNGQVNTQSRTTGTFLDTVFLEISFCARFIVLLKFSRKVV